MISSKIFFLIAHSYNYARNNPISLKDPTGKLPEPIKKGLDKLKKIWNSLTAPKTAPTQGPAPFIGPVKPASDGAKNLSQAGVDFIARQEGFRGSVYKDPVGIPTIGYGHVVLPGENFSSGIDESQGKKLLLQDAQDAVSKVNTFIKTSLSQNQFDALASFAFNVGLSQKSTSTIISTVNSGSASPDSIKKTFLMYNKAGGQTLDGLTNRRTLEANLFLYGEY